MVSRKRPRARGPAMVSFFIPRVLAHVREAGGKSDALERAFRLPTSLPIGELFSAPLDLTRDVADAAQNVMDDPHLGLHLGTKQKRGGYGVLEFAARSAPTVGEAIQRLARYQRLINNLAFFDAEIKDDELVISHRILGDPRGTGVHGHEFTMAVMMKMIRDVTSIPVAPKLARFAHARSTGTLEVKEFFGTDRVEFDRGINTLVFPAEMADMPIVTADADLLELLDGLAQRHLQAMPLSETDGQRSDGDCVASVRNYIVEALKRRAPPSIEDAAEAHHMSVRTLQRRLDDAGTVFNKLVDDARRELSLFYLQEPRLRISDVAARLGYAEVGPFVRAFRRWTGHTPGEYRKRG
ncbi:AraC family transcriptional regulator [Pendulispora brunnea]|uniref:AraC family transcriptional regulator n=1 Tax=Pendulispora brunnea TaxID=2905690 RepID=A0ABZ2K3R5_9BACT